MNRFELRAIRLSLGMSPPNAARLIAEVSPRTWQYWENGCDEVPLSAARKIHWAAARRNRMVADMQERLEGADSIEAVAAFNTPHEAIAAGVVDDELDGFLYISAISHLHVWAGYHLKGSG